MATPKRSYVPPSKQPGLRPNKLESAGPASRSHLPNSVQVALAQRQALGIPKANKRAAPPNLAESRGVEATTEGETATLVMPVIESPTTGVIAFGFTDCGDEINQRSGPAELGGIPLCSRNEQVPRSKAHGRPKVQRLSGDPIAESSSIHEIAEHGLRGASQSMPYLDVIQRAFGRHDVSRVRAHCDDVAAIASRAMGALAFTSGEHVAFAGVPSLRTTAHEAAHVVQQRAGVDLAGGVGCRGDVYEQHADQVAACVLAGQSAESLLDTYVGVPISLASGTAVQRWEGFEHIEIGDGNWRDNHGYLTFRFHETDFPERRLERSRWPEKWVRFLNEEPDPEKRRIRETVLTKGLTYGQVMALAGDLYADFDRLADPQGIFEQLQKASLREVATLVPLLGDKKTTTGELQRATGGRYVALAEVNETHFSSGRRNNREVYRAAHTMALLAAMAGDDAKAWTMNAIADHFLTDAFSGGHILVPRAALVALMEPLAGGAMLAGVIGKVLHDRDGYWGVPVTNERIDSVWIAYGDGFYGAEENATNRVMVQKAIGESRGEVAEAVAKREKFALPQVYAAEALIPFAAYAYNDVVVKWVDTLVAKEYRNPSLFITAEHEWPTVLRRMPWSKRDADDAAAWIYSQSPAALQRVQEHERIRLDKVLAAGGGEFGGARERLRRSAKGVDALEDAVRGYERYLDRIRQNEGWWILDRSAKALKHQSHKFYESIPLREIKNIGIYTEWIWRAEDVAKMASSRDVDVFLECPWDLELFRWILADSKRIARASRHNNGAYVSIVVNGREEVASKTYVIREIEDLERWYSRIPVEIMRRD